ncbi:MAG: phenylalanine--tRNA ligase subunit beta [Verrucomicrobia bacterium]|nr:phenylalanine--tRNA ligase subunit beta [Verrucomicrobiota bacterium]
MKVTFNWLKQYVDFNWSPEELAERLTMLGLEVEGRQKLSGEFDGIVVAQVITRDKHPNADKLSLCRVNDGKGERQIVCGAHNFQAGDKVPLIFPGASLPAKPGEQPLTIKVGKIRGVESQGMMCSPKELGLADDAEGLLILTPDAKVGQPFAEHLGRAGSDIVYDLEVTPNRPDLNSVIGIAREIAALTGNPLRIPQITDHGSRSTHHVSDLVSVRIEDAESCPRYVARVVRGVKVGPSPDWLRHTLEKVGIRSISNVVDVTNYVMMEIGQPLHAFDCHLVAAGESGRPTIVIRRAAAGERFTTLDGQERTLTNDMLLIADEKKAIALAGVMGGQNTEINEKTADVLIESAYFNPVNIRRTSKKLELRTESSYRFERGADVGISDWASRRAAQLIQETAGGEIVEGVVDAYPKPTEPRQIRLRHLKVSQLLGVEIPPAANVQYLRQLGLEIVREDNGQSCTVKGPTFRVDLKRETDLIEEIARLYGVDKIPATPPRGAVGANAYDAVHDQLAEARRILTGIGLNETQGQTLISDTAAQMIVVNGAPQIVALQNPLSSDMNVLRPSLIPGLLDALRHNLNRKNDDAALFETGRVFMRSDAQVREERRLAVALTGARLAAFWSGPDREAKMDIYDLKGALDEFFEQFGVRGLTYVRNESGGPLYLEWATIQLGKQPLGEFGQLMPVIAKRYGLRDAVLLSELNLDLLLARRRSEKSFKGLPAFPSIRRDVAMIVPEKTTHEEVINVAKQTKPLNLETIELFDVFRGQNVPAGQKSVAYAFTYRNAERTLTDAEVNAVHEKLVGQFKQKLQAVVRE